MNTVRLTTVDWTKRLFKLTVLKHGSLLWQHLRLGKETIFLMSISVAHSFFSAGGRV